MPTDPASNPAATTGRNVHLDAMRGLAAVSVLGTHLRQVFFVPYREAGRGLLVDFLYIDHYVARAAVIFFFALSGYLVGMSVVHSIEGARWSWRDYLLARLSRLYVVLVPALLLTALLDWIGRTNALSHWAYFNDPAEAGFTTASLDTLRNFFGSLFFLQNIHTGCYGSNSALWSLSCEFWYYIAFPVIALAVIRRRGWIVSLLLLGAIGWFAGGPVAALFPCWLAGLGIGLLARKRQIRSAYLRRAVAAAAIAGLLGAIAASGVHKLNGYAADYVISGIAMMLIWVALSSPPANGVYARAAVFLSEMSYTLYLVHLPLLFFFRRLVIRGPLWPPDLRHVGLALAPAFAALLVAYIMYWLFESRTNAVRHWLKRRIPAGDPASKLAVAAVPR
jgi:peptidoglycan/LPS O-acetylase OafA/YrhL